MPSGGRCRPRPGTPGGRNSSREAQSNAPSHPLPRERGSGERVPSAARGVRVAGSKPSTAEKEGGPDSRRLWYEGDMQGSEKQQPDFVSLYRQAFAEYGTRALWNKRRLPAPTPQDALVVARALRIEGDRRARRLAEEIEQACRAAV